uniref:Uncharacterized protein n=1 Tax=Hyaloperonospora arabidopsidis (strain Emoy2) TaxID=559515 RepID=M4BI84_HYAAE
MEGSESVQTLIDRFERMARAHASSPAPNSRFVSKRKTMTMPGSGDSPVKKIIHCMNRHRLCGPSTPVHMVAEQEEETVEVGEKVLDEEESAKSKEELLKEEGTEITGEELLDVKDAAEEPLREEETAEPEEEVLDGEEQEDARADPYESVACKDRTADMLHRDDTTTHSSYDTNKSAFYAIAPCSPSASSTASTGSLDSLLNSFDSCLPEQLQTAGEASAEGFRAVRPAAIDCSRRSTFYKDRRPVTTSKLTPPIQYQRPMLTRMPSSTKTTVLAYKSESPRPFLKSERGVAASSPSTRTPSTSSSAPRYMDYDSAPRFVATKAWNLERRRQLEERHRIQATKNARPPKSSKQSSPTIRVNGTGLPEAGSITTACQSDRIIQTKFGRTCSMPGISSSTQRTRQLRRCQSSKSPCPSVP